jgi:2,4-didehydro-3-deoxy-L-rhamnonate hydrolase
MCRFSDDRIGVVRGRLVHDVTQIVERLPAVRYPFPVGDPLIQNLEALRDDMERLADIAPVLEVDSVSFLSPVANPSKVIGIPSNYEAHSREAQNDSQINFRGPKKTIEEQGLFLKANSSLIGPSQGVALRFPNRRTDHEAELGVVIGRRGSDIAEEDAYDYVAGYALAIDMVVRGPEDRSFRKSIDTYAVLGPWLVTKDEVPNPQDLQFELRVGGEVRQRSNTRLMLMSIARQIAWASSFYTLNPGDVLMTGTCEGVGPVRSGDTMRMCIEHIGEMTVPVRMHE